jgi:3-oxoacyl-[acyl-carrier-protein] synthase III
MHIDKVSVAFPSRLVTNTHVVDEIARTSGPGAPDVSKLLLRTFDSIGTSTRYWLADGETALSVTLKACREALSALKDGGEIDLVIYSSVFSDVIEPAAANQTAHMLGLTYAEAFDMKAACDGWMKAMQVAQAFLRTGVHKRILIVNSEFSNVENYAIRPHLYDLKSAQQLKHRLPAYTVGEAATATIVSASESDAPWKFTNITRNDLFDLCSVMSGFYTPDGSSERLAKDGGGWFTSWAADLSAAGVPLSVHTFTKSGIKIDDVDILFTHSSGSKDWKDIAGQIGLGQKLFDMHPRFGNLVSASIPAALAIAETEGRLVRGDNIAILVASAGMTATAAQTVY